MRILDIIEGTIVDGPGLRTSVYVAGCGHECPGCHNPQSWPFDAGQEMTIADIVSRVKASGLNATISGGDPLYQIDDTIELCRRLKAIGCNVWCFTGFEWEQICSSPRLSKLADVVDVIVDGPYIEAMRDTGLRFRGSSNQRIIDVAKSTATDVVIWTDDNSAYPF